jgi:FkbM family methyltransferase
LHLEEAGWTGLLVEPLREHAERLRRTRKAKVAEVACAGPGSDGKEMPLHVAGPDGVQSTLALHFFKAGITATETRTVATATLDSLLQKYAIDHMEFLSIDVEGFELDVLRGFSLGRYRPRLVLLEDRVHDLHLHRHMRAHGYRVTRRIGQNAWYVPAGVEFPISPIGRLQLFRKYHLALPFRRLRRLLLSGRTSN